MGCACISFTLVETSGIGFASESANNDEAPKRRKRGGNQSDDGSYQGGGGGSSSSSGGAGGGMAGGGSSGIGGWNMAGLQRVNLPELQYFKDTHVLQYRVSDEYDVEVPQDVIVASHMLYQVAFPSCSLFVC